MKVFIVAIPLFNSSMAVEAYRLSDRRGEKALSVENDYRKVTEAFFTPGLDLVEQIGPEPFAGDKPLMIDINRFQLQVGVPTNADIAPEKLVCVVPGDLPIEEDLLDKCRHLKQRGYALALNGLPEGGTANPYPQLADYIILNYKDMYFQDHYNLINSAMPHVIIVVSNVPDVESYEQFSDDTRSLFSGAFYSRPITTGISEISPIKINALQLLKHVNEEDFDLADIVKIIGRDPALTISLLRFINSNAVGLSRKIDSIQSAVAILGQQEVRRWATVAISVSLAQDRPGEITKLSLVRAKFAENLAPAFELGVFQPSLFIAGLFSLLDVILQKPMEEAIKEVAVDERVRKALVDKSGDLYKVLELIYTYERGDWDNTSILLINNNPEIDIEAVTKAFIDALVWYHKLLETIDSEPVDEEAKEA